MLAIENLVLRVLLYLPAIGGMDLFYIDDIEGDAIGKAAVYTV